MNNGEPLSMLPIAILSPNDYKNFEFRAFDYVPFRA